MKKLFMIMFLLFSVLLSNSLWAQSRMSEQEKAEAIERYEAYQEKLNLSEEQQPRVEEINRAYFEGLSQLRNANASRLDKYRTYKDLSNTRDRQMKEVLDKEQYKIYKEFQAEMRADFRERRRNG